MLQIGYNSVYDASKRVSRERNEDIFVGFWFHLKTNHSVEVEECEKDIALTKQVQGN